MTPAARALRSRITRASNALAPDVRSAILKGFDTLRSLLTDAELAKFAKSPNATRVLMETLGSENIDRAFAGVRSTLRDGVETAAQAATRALPGAAGRTGIAFDVLSPSVVEGVQQLNTRVMETLAGNVRETVRAVVQRGLEAGQNPRAVARDLRSMLSLAPNQANAVANFRGLLEVGDRAALTRALRDKRFDGTLRKAFGPDGNGLTAAQIDTMTDAYLRRMEAFNAETIARTATLDAQRLGQHLTWEQAVERGDIDGDKLTKRWSGTLDDRERDTHLTMEGETVPWDQPFSNGQMVPGDDEYNCRCVAIYETRGTVKPGAGARGLEASQLRVGSQLREGTGTLMPAAVAPPAAPPPPPTGPNTGRDLASELQSRADDIIYRGGEGSIKNEDLAQGVLFEMQGFNKLPQVGTAAEVDAVIQRGGTELYRGVSNSGNQYDPKAIVEQFRSGKMFYGRGFYGNGTYVGASVEVDKGIGNAIGLKPGVIADRAAMSTGKTSPFRVATDYAGSNGGIMRMVLLPGARVGESAALKKEAESLLQWVVKQRDAISLRVPEQWLKAQDAVSVPASERGSSAYKAAARLLAKAPESMRADLARWKELRTLGKIAGDRGRYAAFRGYDAYLIAESGDQGYMVLLNRTAVMVEKTTYAYNGDPL